MSYIFGLVLLFFMAIVVHEAGHAIAMKRRNIDIEEAGIGFPLPERFKKFKLTLRPKFLPFPIVICLVPLGGYVMTTREGKKSFERMSYKDQASCYAAGVIMNTAFAAVLFIAAMAIHPVWQRVHVIALLLSIAALTVTLLFRRVLSWLMPVLGIVVFGYTVYLLFELLSSAAAQAIPTPSFDSAAWYKILVIGGVMSFVMGLIQTMPLGTLDGGKLVSALLRSRHLHKFDKIYVTATEVILLLFTVLSAVAVLILLA